MTPYQFAFIFLLNSIAGNLINFLILVELKKINLINSFTQLNTSN
jgi:hypothetical protein